MGYAAYIFRSAKDTKNKPDAGVVTGKILSRGLLLIPLALRLKFVAFLNHTIDVLMDTSSHIQATQQAPEQLAIFKHHQDKA